MSEATRRHRQRVFARQAKEALAGCGIEVAVVGDWGADDSPGRSSWYCASASWVWFDTHSGGSSLFALYQQTDPISGQRPPSGACSVASAAAPNPRSRCSASQSASWSRTQRASEIVAAREEWGRCAYGPALRLCTETLAQRSPRRTRRRSQCQDDVAFERSSASLRARLPPKALDVLAVLRLRHQRGGRSRVSRFTRNRTSSTS